MKARRSIFEPLRDAREPYVFLNIIYYGLVAASMAYTAFDRSLHDTLMTAVVESLSQGPLAPVLEAYTAQRVLEAIGLTAGINLAVGSFVSITLPSLIIPFSGLLMAAFRALTWGVLFSPQIGEGLAPRRAGNRGAARRSGAPRRPGLRARRVGRVRPGKGLPAAACRREGPAPAGVLARPEGIGPHLRAGRARPTCGGSLRGTDRRDRPARTPLGS